jgi:hypothetical protein
MSNSCKYSFPVADYKVPIIQTNLPAVPSGTSVNVNLAKDLPANIIQSINTQDAYVKLSCYTLTKPVEYARIQRGSYVSQNRQITLIRGQSPYEDNTGGTAESIQVSSSGQIILDFSAWRPADISVVISDLCNIKTQNLAFLTTNLPTASSTVKGAVLIAYNNPSISTTTPYKVIANDNPLLNRLANALLGQDAQSADLNWDGSISPSADTKLSRITNILNRATITQTRYQAFVDWIDSLPQ